MGVSYETRYMEGSVPRRSARAARIDGAGYFRIFSQIVFPMVGLMLYNAYPGFRDVWSAGSNGTVFNNL